MGDRYVVGGQAVVGRELVQVRRIRIADDLAEAVVFHDDDEDVIEVRHQGLSHLTTVAFCERCSPAFHFGDPVSDGEHLTSYGLQANPGGLQPGGDPLDDPPL